MADIKLKHEMLPNGVCHIRASGYLDAHTRDELDKVVRSVYRQHCFKLAIDLSKIEFLSSAGAGILLGAIGEAQEQGGSIVLINPSNAVRTVFDQLGMLHMFRISRSKNEAVNAFGY